MMIEVKLVEQISNELEERMRKDLDRYENSHRIDLNYKRFSLVLKNHNDEEVGVLKAYTVFGEIYVDDLWVQSPHRGKGYGRKLLRELEERFNDQGFNNISLVTSAFQAPEFYKKCGFELEFVRKNLQNPKLTKFFFVKYFKGEVQNQGVLYETPQSNF